MTEGILTDGISKTHDGKLDIELFVLDTLIEGGRRVKIRTDGASS